MKKEAFPSGNTSFLSAFGALGEEGIYKSVQVAVHDALDAAGLVLGTQVLDKLVGHEHIGADLAAPLDLHLHALDVAYLFKVLALLDLGKTGTQHVAAVFKVLEVASLHLGGNHDAGGDMGETDSGGGLVDLLAAGAGGTLRYLIP